MIAELFRRLPKIGKPTEKKSEQIDVKGPFARFIGNGWSIIEKESENRISEFADIEKVLKSVRFVTCLKGHEKYISGEERLRRLKKSENLICLGGDIFQILWGKLSVIPESWKNKVNGLPRQICFDGVLLLDPEGDRYVPCICWGIQTFGIQLKPLSFEYFGYSSPSAVIDKNSLNII
ncbi:MAG: hypothetical protein WCW87_02460 [Candidatus Paceibacterota bacterium]